MKCITAQQYMMERLFDELPPMETSQLERHLHICSVCAEQWKDVLEGHNAMSQLIIPEIPSALEDRILVSSKEFSADTHIPSKWRYGLWIGVAASFLAVFFAGVWLADSVKFSTGKTGSSIALMPMKDTVQPPAERFNKARGKQSAPLPATQPIEMNTSTMATGALEQKTEAIESITTATAGREVNLAIAGLAADSSNQLALADVPIATQEMKSGYLVKVMRGGYDPDILVTVPPHPDDKMIRNPGPHPDDKMMIKPKDSKEMILSEPLSPQSQEKTVALAVDRKEEAKAEKTATKPVSEKSAKEYFETALKLYNTAFTKIGDEQKSLLQSAVIFLNDLESKFPSESKWLAMAIILKADSQKQLGQREEAIHTYQSLIRHFYKMEPFCEQARVSILQLLITDNNTIPIAVTALSTFHQLYPKSNDYPKIAFAVADMVKSSSPETAYVVCSEILKSCEQSHPNWKKANQLAQSISESIKEKYIIKEYWFLGPMPEETQSNDILPFQPDKSYAGSDNKDVKWIRGMLNETRINNNAVQLPVPDGHHSLFALTNVYSEVNQTVNVRIVCNSNAFRLWINEEPVYADQSMAAWDYIQPGMQLQKGWNSIMVKTLPYSNSKTWDFGLQFLDANNQVMTDLKVDPVKG